MVDIQSATDEIRRRRKERRKKEERKKKKPQDKNIMTTSAMQGSHNNRDIKETGVVNDTKRLGADC